MVEITNIEIMNIIYVIVTLAVSFTIILKYFKYKERNLLLVGIAWLGLAIIYFPDITGTLIKIGDLQYNSATLLAVDVFFNFLLIPFFVFLWLIAISDLMSLKKGTKIGVFSIYIIITVIYEIYVLFLLITDPAALGFIDPNNQLGPTATWSDDTGFLLFIYIVIFLLTGLVFAAQSFRSQSKEIKLKGTILIIAFVSFTIGALFDTLVTPMVESLQLTFPTELQMTIGRTIMVISTILFYLGFTLPNWIKRLFIKD